MERKTFQVKKKCRPVLSHYQTTMKSDGTNQVKDVEKVIFHKNGYYFYKKILFNKQSCKYNKGIFATNDIMKPNCTRHKINS